MDIASLTELTSTIANDDMLVIYDLSATANKKHKAQASVTNEGLVEMATDAEATTATDETRYINPKQAKDNYGNNYVSSASVSASVTVPASANIAIISATCTAT